MRLLCNYIDNGGGGPARFEVVVSAPVVFMTDYGHPLTGDPSAAPLKFGEDTYTAHRFFALEVESGDEGTFTDFKIWGSTSSPSISLIRTTPYTQLGGIDEVASLSPTDGNYNTLYYNAEALPTAEGSALLFDTNTLQVGGTTKTKYIGVAVKLLENPSSSSTETITLNFSWRQTL